MVFTIIGIGILGVSAVMLFKEIKPSFSVFMSLTTCVIISLIIISNCKGIFTQVDGYLSKLSISKEIITTALKIAGISYLIEFASDIADESGMQSIAHKIILAGKIVVASICLPYVFDLFDMVLGLI